MSYHFENLVFEGGGVKGVAYVGALEVLEGEEILKNIKRVGGTSAGSIIALLVGLGYKINEIKEELEKMSMKNFMDDDIGAIRDIYRLLFNGYGWFKGDVFMEWIEEIIYKKTKNKNSTFKDIKGNPEFKGMFFQGTNLSTHFVETFSTEEKQCEDMLLKDAIRISMSIPLFFKSVKRNDCYYVDGGVLSNYPVRLFDDKKYISNEKHYSIPDYYEEIRKIKEDTSYVYNKETLGFRLDSKDKIGIFRGTARPKNNEVNSFFDYTWHLIATLMESQENTHLTEHDKDRTIYIDSLNISTVDFDIDCEERQKLIDSGRLSTETYLKKYTNDREVLKGNNEKPSMHNLIKSN